MVSLKHTHDAPCGPLRENMTLLTKQEYITYRNDASREPNHGHTPPPAACTKIVMCGHEVPDTYLQTDTKLQTY